MTRVATHDNSYLATDPIGKLIVRFATPCVVAMLVNSLYNIVDQIFIGRGVGYLGNGATNVVFPITIIALALALLIGDGAAACFSLKMGEGSPAKAYKAMGNALVLLAAVGVLLAVIASLFLKPLLVFFGATEAILPYALEYGGLIVFGVPFVMLGTGANSLIRASGNPSFAMKSMIVGAVVNTVLDPIFIFPLGMGVRGAAIATVVGQLASFGLSLAYLARGGNPGMRRENLRLEKSAVSSLLGCGVSSCINQAAITVGVILINNTLTAYGAQSQYGAEIPLTSVGIVMKVNQIVVSILVGIAVGAQPIIGYNYGAGNLHRVKKTFGITVTLASAVSLCASVVFLFFPQTIIDIFGSGDQLYNEFSRKTFRVFLMLCALNGFQIATGVFFQAMGKPLKAAVVSLSRQVLVLIPAVLILPGLYGVDGVLYAGPLSDGIAFVAAAVLVIREVRAMSASRHVSVRLEPAGEEAGLSAARESVRVALAK